MKYAVTLLILITGLAAAPGDKGPRAGGPSGTDVWPQFRGPASAGIAVGSDLPDTWSADRNIVWKIDLPGRAWSSPIVWGDKVFITSAINEGKGEEPKKGLYFGGDRSEPSPEVHRWVVSCIDFATGKTLWEKVAHRGKPDSSHHIKNTLASETPVTDGARVYAYFGSLGVFCYDADGREVWSQLWKRRKMRSGWGTAASPVLYKDRLYIVNDNEEESFLVALDKLTGKEVWRTPRDEKSNWATPFIWENERRTEIVTPGTGKVRSYDLDGKLLWEFSGMSKIAIPTPLAAHGLLYISSGFVLDNHRPVYAIKPGASGDISLKPGETSNSFIVWYQKLAGPYNPSPIVYGDHLYVLYDRGLFACYNARTGEVVYDKQRIGPNATAFTASPWAYEGRLFCLSEDGDTFVIQAGPQFKVLGKNSLDDMCMASPAIARGSLFIRTASRLYRIAAKVNTASRE